MKFIRISIGILIVTLVFSGCKKNEDFITQTTADLTPSLRFSINQEETQHEPFAYECENEGLKTVAISNKEELLDPNADWSLAEPGDFNFQFYSFEGGEPSYGLTFKLEQSAVGSDLLFAFLPNTTFLVDNDSEYITGSIDGSISNIVGEEVFSIDIEFTSRIIEISEYCQ